MSAARRPVTLLLVALAALAAHDTAGAPAEATGGNAAGAETPGPLQGPQVVVVSELPQPSPAAGGAFEAPPRAAASGVRMQEGPRAVPAANALDHALLGAGGASPRAAPTRSLLAFDGLDADNNRLAGITPPDPQVAVGPAHVFEMVNVVGRIYDRTGRPLQTFELADFFAVPAGYLDTDPKLIYDHRSGRWFASYVSLRDNATTPDQGRLHLAVSTSSDPTAAWNLYALSYTNVLPDYPGIGLTNDKVTVSANLADIDGPCAPGICGEQTVVFQKSDLIAGASGSDVGMFTFPVNPTRFTVRPAHSLSSGNDQYLTTWELTSFDKLTVIRITGTPDAGNVTEAAATTLTTLFQDSPPPSATAGTAACVIFDLTLGPPPCIESGDFRMLEAVWRDNSLWSAASAACIPPGDGAVRSCAHLVEVQTVDTPSVTQDIMFGAPGQHYSWPAIRTDVSGDLYVSLTHTNTAIFAEARIAGRRATDPPNAMSGTTLLRAGDVVHTSGRWGDYLGAAVDPTQPACVWVVGEYAKNTSVADWGTFIAATSYSDACGPSGPLVGDVDCNGVVNPIDAALILQRDAGFLSSLRCQENADVNLDRRTNAIDAALILQLAAGLVETLPA